MKSFKEFLEEKEPEILATRAENAKKLQSWIESVKELFIEVKKWLRESDPNNLLRFEATTKHVKEPYIGSYDIDSLSIILEGSVVDLRPVARFVKGPLFKPMVATGDWTGRIELTNGDQSFSIFRFTTHNDQHSWFLRSDDNHVTHLSQAIFEQALIALLS